MKKIDRKKIKLTSIIVAYKHQINRQFDEIRDYIRETNSLIKIKQKRVGEFIDNKLKGIQNENEAVEVIDFYLEDFDKYDKTYIELLINSTFVSSFSLFERSFLDICEYAQREKDSVLSVADLSGNGIIHKCKRFIEKGLEIDLNGLNSSWQVITDYNKIRNLIVHNASNFDKEDKPIEKQKLFSLINENPYIKQKYEHMGYFYIQDSQYVIDFCNNAEKYLSDTIELILKSNK